VSVTSAELDRRTRRYPWGGGKDPRYLGAALL
jgi:hypothetical protein